MSGANALRPFAVIEMTLWRPSFAARTFFEQPLLAEAAQDAAQIPVVEIEVGGELARGHVLAMRQLVEHARLGEREARVHQALLQQAELARVEAREAPHRGDALFELGMCSWATCRVEQAGDSVKQLFD